MDTRGKIKEGLLNGGPVLKNLVEHQLYFILFLFLLAISYIGIHNAVSRTLVAQRSLEKELKIYRAELATCVSEYNALSKKEEVTRRLRLLGSNVLPPVAPPKRIIMEDYRDE